MLYERSQLMPKRPGKQHGLELTSERNSFPKLSKPLPRLKQSITLAVKYKP